MRRARKVDANQREIVAALRAAGCSVEVLSDVGRGVPDLLVMNGRTLDLYLLEVKLPDEDLNKRQCEWHEAWRFIPGVVSSPEEALS